MTSTDTTFSMMALSLIKRYESQASAIVANRTRLLDACGDQQTSQTWDLIFREIKKFETNSVRGEPEIESLEQIEKLDGVYASASEFSRIDLKDIQTDLRVWLISKDGQNLNQS